LKAANRAIKFFPDVLRLNGGKFEGKPFVLLPWQAFVIGSVFGWKAADGTRRFRVVFAETSKGSGKSPLAAGVGLLMLAADGEARAEVYSAATKKDQAKVLFRDAVAMVEMSPALSERLVMTGGEVEKTNIAYLATGSFFRPISTEDRGKGQSGPRPHCSLVDEIHEHPTNAMVEFLRAGTKGREQALMFMITNSGSDMQSVCREYHDYGAKVAAGILQDDSFFAYICGLDEGEDPFKDESCWIKANPSLGETFELKYLREQVTQARGMASKENLVRRLNFCEWTDAADAWISRELWQACEVDLDLAEFHGRRCHGGLDLSKKLDLTAKAMVFESDDGTFDAFVEFWTPGETIKDREDNDRVPYSKWVKDGYLIATPGKSVKYSFVAERLGEEAVDFDIGCISYDRWRIDDLIEELEDADVPAWKMTADNQTGDGIALIECGQGFKDMAGAVDALEELITDGNIRIHRNPVLRWNAASAVLEEDAAGNRKFTKRKSTGRIDGIVALAMAVKAAKAAPEEDANIEYQPGQMFLSRGGG
jgi:phage terminase large subunit-like protein